MNRRAFLQRLAYGTVAAAALVSLPASIVKAAPALVEPARLYACERMRAAFNAYAKGRRGEMPRAIWVGRDLYDMFEGELAANRRFVSADATQIDGLAFKGTTVYPRGRGYSISFEEAA